MDEKSDVMRVGENPPENYSLEMVDTIFADTLSRGMQNAIVSQQNAQMASSSSVTHACARILQAQAKPEAAMTLESGVSQSNEVKPERVTAPQPESEAKRPNRRGYWAFGGALLLMGLAGYAGWVYWQALNLV